MCSQQAKDYCCLTSFYETKPKEDAVANSTLLYRGTQDGALGVAFKMADSELIALSDEDNVKYM